MNETQFAAQFLNHEKSVLEFLPIFKVLLFQFLTSFYCLYFLSFNLLVRL